VARLASRIVQIRDGQIVEDQRAAAWRAARGIWRAPLAGMGESPATVRGPRPRVSLLCLEQECLVRDGQV